MTNLIRAEALKIRTTNTWWLFGLGTFLFTAAALVVNIIQAHLYLTVRPQIPPGASAEQAQQIREQLAARDDVAGEAASIFTSGQYFGLLLVMLLAMLVITNEFFHQTATTTFLATPRRTRVITAKLITVALASVVFWALSLVMNLVAGSIYLDADGFSPHLGDWPVWRAILLNLMAYVIWAVFGVGLGVLIRSQIGAVVTGTVLYLVGTSAAQVVFFVIHEFWIKQDWVLTAQVVVPSIASQIMISVIKLYPQSPAQWVGAAVLIGYGVVFGVIGVLITRRRDIT
ncbi:MAG TPA: ABC transporter permease [Micromonosporaceae bacterium]